MKVTIVQIRTTANTYSNSASCTGNWSAAASWRPPLQTDAANDDSDDATMGYWFRYDWRQSADAFRTHSQTRRITHELARPDGNAVAQFHSLDGWCNGCTPNRTACTATQSNTQHARTARIVSKIDCVRSKYSELSSPLSSSECTAVHSRMCGRCCCCCRCYCRRRCLCTRIRIMSISSYRLFACVCFFVCICRRK